MSALFLQGNAKSVLKNLPADYFHCCVTSPPYFGLRRYDGGIEQWDGGWRGQLGAEPTPDCGRPFSELRDGLTAKERAFVIKRLQEEGLL